jgi:hypothetical protein
LFAIGILMIVSCSKKVTPGKSADNLVIYPPPPDTTRIQFLAKIRNSTDVTGNRKGFKKFILGADDVIEIGKPYGVAISNGKIYLCETFRKGIDIIDLKKHSFSEFVPKGKGALKLPINCVVDDRGYLYVADADRKQIVIFNDKREYQASFGEQENFKPTDVFVAQGKIWVCNMSGRQIHVYANDSSYSLLDQFPAKGVTGSGGLFSPTNLYVKDSSVYVSDFGDFKVKRYTTEGVFMDTIGKCFKYLCCGCRV